MSRQDKKRYSVDNPWRADEVVAMFEMCVIKRRRGEIPRALDAGIHARRPAPLALVLRSPQLLTTRH
ncbi:unnamed protein product, partial [Brenthis ino]